MYNLEWGKYFVDIKICMKMAIRYLVETPDQHARSHIKDMTSASKLITLELDKNLRHYYVL
jgi:hypothetical protein